MAYILIVHIALMPGETLKIATKYTLVFSYYDFSFQLLLVRLIKTKMVLFFFSFFWGVRGNTSFRISVICRLAAHFTCLTVIRKLDSI